MRAIGCVLLLSGFFIALAALTLLTGVGQRMAFVGAALAVEVLGVAMLTQSYRAAQGRPG